MASAHRHELMEEWDLARRQQPFKRAAPDRHVNPTARFVGSDRRSRYARAVAGPNF
jgi:hypothetical protein